MGWYITCEICGTEGKYNVECDCYERETEQLLSRMTGCTIEESLFIVDGEAKFLVQKLRPSSGPVFYLKINIQDGGGEYSCFRKVVELTEDAFIGYRDHPPGDGDRDDDEDDEDEDESADPPAVPLTSQSRPVVDLPIPVSPAVTGAGVPPLQLPSQGHSGILHLPPLTIPRDRRVSVPPIQLPPLPPSQQNGAPPRPFYPRSNPLTIPTH
jgi:hypothetical protein